MSGSVRHDGARRGLTLPLPVEPFRYYAFGERVVHLDGHVEVEGAYYSVPPGHIGRKLHVQWDSLHVRPVSGRVDQGGHPPWPPTDPDVRDYRIRLFGSWVRCESAVAVDDAVDGHQGARVLGPVAGSCLFPGVSLVDQVAEKWRGVRGAGGVAGRARPEDERPSSSRWRAFLRRRARVCEWGGPVVQR